MSMLVRYIGLKDMLQDTELDATGFLRIGPSEYTRRRLIEQIKSNYKFKKSTTLLESGLGVDIGSVSSDVDL